METAMTEQRTLEQILGSIQEREAILDRPDFDPAKFIGVAKFEEGATNDFEALRAKVDGMAFVIEDWETFAARYDAKEAFYKAKAKAAWAKAQGLRDYAVHQMKFAKFERLPGAERHAFVWKTWHDQKLVLLRKEATADDFVRGEA